MIDFDYKGKKIELDYSEEISDKIRFPFRVKGFCAGEINDYNEIEQRAIYRMIQDAAMKKAKCSIEKIVGIKQKASSVHFNGKAGIRLDLTGVVVYRKNS